ncbi:Transcriptional regulator [Tolypocladium capitatum]|uniref:Transcriptional regulator n=1 Tax=Tolypocladium capitatum TaxID=45235 RepID=A0A2K3QFH1_9HYPO|nr:Transcriptional regulator [Tolypocladium capitatum]
MAKVALIGTCDTKLRELVFLRDRIQETSGVSAILIDVGRNETKNDAISISQSELLAKYGGGKNISELSRRNFIEFISPCASEAVQELYQSGTIDGVVSIGGSCGTSLASAIMRQVLPIGFPKLIVSTIASGDTSHIVGETDIMLLYSVVDIAGLNQVLRDVLSNAGVAIAAAALSYAGRRASKEKLPSSKKRVGITMFGVTTPAVDVIRSHLESNYPIETTVFHATGPGGRAMERLVRDGELDAVIDLTTTEICDFVMGGVMSAGDKRLDAAAEVGVPTIVSLGATDMANFGPTVTVPAKYRNRKTVEHNPITTLVRSSADDCRQIGEFICVKLRNARRPEMVQLWIPKGGVSMLAVPGGPFADGEADGVLFSTIRDGLAGSGVEVVDDERDINDAGFARDVAEALVAKMGLEPMDTFQSRSNVH